MNFIDGCTLQELLDDCRNDEDKAKALPLLRTDLLASIGKMLLEDLNKLCNANIQHEDLTPSNIIVSKNKDGSIKEVILIDLGRNYLYTHRTGLVENREALFVAPEIRVDSNGTSTNTSDLYSFGMILIELADPQGVQGKTIPDSFYEYAPALARFVEDLVDVNPDKRLLIFSHDRNDLLSAFVDELNVLPSDSEVKPWLPFRLWGRQIEIKPKVQFWVQQIRDLFFPSSQLALLRELWRLNRSPKHTEIAKYSGRLYRMAESSAPFTQPYFPFCITLVSSDIWNRRLWLNEFRSAIYLPL